MANSSESGINPCFALTFQFDAMLRGGTFAGLRQGAVELERGLALSLRNIFENDQRPARFSPSPNDI